MIMFVKMDNYKKKRSWVEVEIWAGEAGQEEELPGRAEGKKRRGLAVWACGGENGIVVNGPDGDRFVVCEQEGELYVG